MTAPDPETWAALQKGPLRGVVEPARYCHEAGCSRSTTSHLWDPEACPAPADVPASEAIRTATYTDPTTGWTQVVEVLGDAAPKPGSSDQWMSIRNTYNEQADVPGTTLRDFHWEPPFLAPEDDR